MSMHDVLVHCSARMGPPFNEPPEDITWLC